MLAPAAAQQPRLNQLYQQFEQHYGGGRYAEAERVGRQAAELCQRQLGRDNLQCTPILDRLGNALDSLGKYAEAEALHGRVLAIREKTLGAEHPDVTISLINLANAVTQQGKLAEAERLYRRVLAIREKALGRDHPDLAGILGNLATVCEQQGKTAEAEALLQRALAIRERALGADHPDVARIVHKLGDVHESQGRYADAERLYRRALAIRERALGESHREVAATLDGLASVYATQERFAEAEGLYRRSLAIREKALGADHPAVAYPLHNLGIAYQEQGKYAEAQPLLERALAIRQRVYGDSHPNVASSLESLASLHASQGRSAEAEGLYQRSLDIRQRILGADHPSVAYSLGNLAIQSRRQGKHADAERFYRRALAILEKALGETHPDVAKGLNNLAVAFDAAGDIGNALTFSRRATAAVLAHAATELAGSRQSGASSGLVEQSANYFYLHVATLARAVGTGIAPAPGLAREALEMAQWASSSSAAGAVQQMAARFAGGAGLGARVRQNQDLAAALREREQALIAALSKPEKQQDRAAIGASRKQIAEIDRELAANAARLEREFPNYAALASPKPLKAEEVQKLLGADEVMVFFLNGVEESFVFALNRDQFEWRTLPIAAKSLSERVGALRRAIGDPSAVQRGLGRGDDCGPAPGDPRGLGRKACGSGFDLGAAHDLYQTLLGPIADVFKDKKQLIVVPSGVLTGLPFQALLTEKATSQQTLADAPWLIRRHALTVLPSVASLYALRTFAKDGRGAKPFIGFGDPVFQAGTPAARERTAATARGVSDYFRGGQADAAELRKLAPLADTATELRQIARSLGAPESEIVLGAKASEATVKALSENGQLSAYRIVHFATHGLVAGDIKGLAEPALALSVPEQPSEADDGLLTASEAALLKLNADWVVLSACNTAAGDTPGAEALSGLARAFFYAGARALLVSHWPVDSAAAVKLTTRTFAEMQTNPALGRAEALRRAMLALMQDKSSPRNAHPAIWAPFMVVGEGTMK